eukprot:1583039-Amphidinium_carterae.1
MQEFESGCGPAMGVAPPASSNSSKSDRDKDLECSAFERALKSVCKPKVVAEYDALQGAARALM